MRDRTTVENCCAAVGNDEGAVSGNDLIDRSATLQRPTAPLIGS